MRSVNLKWSHRMQRKDKEINEKAESKRKEKWGLKILDFSEKETRIIRTDIIYQRWNWGKFSWAEQTNM